MMLFRFGEPGRERPAVLLGEGRGIDVSSQVHDFDGSFLGHGGVARLAASLADLDGDLPVIDLASARLGPAVASIGKIVCVGLDYRAHAAETGQEAPDEPALFLGCRTPLWEPSTPS